MNYTFSLVQLIFEDSAVQSQIRWYRSGRSRYLLLLQFSCPFLNTDSFDIAIDNFL